MFKKKKKKSQCRNVVRDKSNFVTKTVWLFDWQIEGLQTSCRVAENHSHIFGNFFVDTARTVCQITKYKYIGFYWSYLLLLSIETTFRSHEARWKNISKQWGKTHFPFIISVTVLKEWMKEVRSLHAAATSWNPSVLSQALAFFSFRSFSYCFLCSRISSEYSYRASSVVPFCFLVPAVHI